MKKIILLGVLFSAVFATSLEDRVKLLEEKVSKLEKKLNIVDNSQKKIVKNINDSFVPKCNKLKLVDYSYKYEDSGFFKSYNFNYQIKNEYKKPVVYIYAGVNFIDDEGTELLENYIKKHITIKPNEIKTIKSNYLIQADSLAEYFKDTPKNELKVEFKIFKIKFSDGKEIKCN